MYNVFLKVGVIYITQVPIHLFMTKKMCYFIF